jgi:hypothetical protein
MSLYVPPGVAGKYESNLLPASRVGTQVTAHATIHTKGSWISLIDPTDEPSYGFWARFTGVAASAAVTSMLLDIGYGPTGGGSERIIWPNINLGATGVAEGGPYKWVFCPRYIPAGVRVSARSQALLTADTVSVSIWLCQRPLYPPDCCGDITDYGTVLASSRGTSVTPGASAFPATWTQLDATIDRAHRYWTVMIDQLADTTTTATTTLLVQIGYGPTSTDVTVIGEFAVVTSTSEEFGNTFPPLIYKEVPAGGPLWCRIAAGTTEALGAIAYGMD